VPGSSRLVLSETSLALRRALDPTDYDWAAPITGMHSFAEGKMRHTRAMNAGAIVTDGASLADAKPVVPPGA
jgi:hypothetical protein